MAMRFRRSTKIAPGVKVNFNEKSVGVTVGTKGAHYSVNSSGQKTTTVGAPGTGVSFVDVSSKKGGGSAQVTAKPRLASKGTYIALLVLAVLLAIFGVALLFVSPVFGVVLLVVAAICAINSVNGLRRHRKG